MSGPLSDDELRAVLAEARAVSSHVVVERAMLETLIGELLSWRGRADASATAAGPSASEPRCFRCESVWFRTFDHQTGGLECLGCHTRYQRSNPPAPAAPPASTEPADRSTANGGTPAAPGLTLGSHYYPRAPDRTSSCAHGCGAWVGPWRSGPHDDPTLDPFGACPKNPGAAVQTKEARRIFKNPGPFCWSCVVTPRIATARCGWCKRPVCDSCFPKHGQSVCEKLP